MSAYDMEGFSKRVIEVQKTGSEEGDLEALAKAINTGAEYAKEQNAVGFALMVVTKKGATWISHGSISDIGLGLTETAPGFLSTLAETLLGSLAESKLDEAEEGMQDDGKSADLMRAIIRAMASSPNDRAH